MCGEGVGLRCVGVGMARWCGFPLGCPSSCDNNVKYNRCVGGERHSGQGQDQGYHHIRNPHVQEVRCLVPDLLVGFGPTPPCGQIIITQHNRYLKYLTKKFLKKHNVRDWLRVIASNKDRKYVVVWSTQLAYNIASQSFFTQSSQHSVYELRYFNIADNEAEDEE